jgi:hypothetical protein
MVGFYVIANALQYEREDSFGQKRTIKPSFLVSICDALLLASHRPISFENSLEPSLALHQQL